MIKVCVLLIAVLLVLKGGLAIIGKLQDNKSVEVSGTVDGNVSVDISADTDESVVEEKLSRKEMKEYISEHKELYPKKLRKFCKTYPQTLKFVYDYPKKKDLEPEINLSEEYVHDEIPLLIQWDERWGYSKYGDSIIGMAGCGPTCLSMVYIGITGDVSFNPKEMAKFAEEHDYYEEGSGTKWELMSEGAKKIGLKSKEIGLSKEELKEAVKKGHPVILSVSEGEFTTSGHFIVVTGMKGGKFIINDPNSRENSEKLWKYSEFSDQVKNLWAFSP